MKHTMVLLLAAVITPCGSLCQDEPIASRPVRRVLSKYKAHEYEMVVSEHQLFATPVWRKQDESPPLAAREAVRAARGKLETAIPEAKRWRPRRIAIETSIDDYWVYVVTFDTTPPDAIEKTWPPFDVLVLMNGEAVEIKRTGPWRPPEDRR